MPCAGISASAARRASLRRAPMHGRPSRVRWQPAGPSACRSTVSIYRISRSPFISPDTSSRHTGWSATTCCWSTRNRRARCSERRARRSRRRDSPRGRCPRRRGRGPSMRDGLRRGCRRRSARPSARMPARTSRRNSAAPRISASKSSRIRCRRGDASPRSPPRTWRLRACSWNAPVPVARCFATSTGISSMSRASTCRARVRRSIPVMHCSPKPLPHGAAWRIASLAAARGNEAALAEASARCRRIAGLEVRAMQALAKL